MSMLVNREPFRGSFAAVQAPDTGVSFVGDGLDVRVAHLWGEMHGMSVVAGSWDSCGHAILVAKQMAVGMGRGETLFACSDVFLAASDEGQHHLGCDRKKKTSGGPFRCGR